MLPMRDDEQTITEDRATQPMEAGGWVSQIEEYNYTYVIFHEVAPNLWNKI